MKPNDIKSAFEDAHFHRRFCYDKNRQGEYLDPVVNDYYCSFLSGVLYEKLVQIEATKKKVGEK